MISVNEIKSHLNASVELDSRATELAWTFAKHLHRVMPSVYSEMKYEDLPESIKRSDLEFALSLTRDLVRSLDESRIFDADKKELENIIGRYVYYDNVKRISEDRVLDPVLLDHCPAWEDFNTDNMPPLDFDMESYFVEYDNILSAFLSARKQYLEEDLPYHLYNDPSFVEGVNYNTTGDKYLIDLVAKEYDDAIREEVKEKGNPRRPNDYFHHVPLSVISWETLKKTGDESLLQYRMGFISKKEFEDKVHPVYHDRMRKATEAVRLLKALTPLKQVTDLSYDEIAQYYLKNFPYGGPEAAKETLNCIIKAIANGLEKLRETADRLITRKPTLGVSNVCAHFIGVEPRTPAVEALEKLYANNISSAGGMTAAEAATFFAKKTAGNPTIVVRESGDGELGRSLLCDPTVYRDLNVKTPPGKNTLLAVEDLRTNSLLTRSSNKYEISPYPEQRNTAMFQFRKDGILFSVNIPDVDERGFTKRLLSSYYTKEGTLALMTDHTMGYISVQSVIEHACKALRRESHGMDPYELNGAAYVFGDLVSAENALKQQYDGLLADMKMFKQSEFSRTQVADLSQSDTLSETVRRLIDSPVVEDAMQSCYDKQSFRNECIIKYNQFVLKNGLQKELPVYPIQQRQLQAVTVERDAEDRNAARERHREMLREKDAKSNLIRINKPSPVKKETKTMKMKH